MGIFHRLRPDPTCPHGRPMTSRGTWCRICEGDGRAMQGTFVDRGGRSTQVSNNAVRRGR